MSDVEKAVHAKNEKLGEFMAKRNVVGVGVGFKNKLGENTGDASVVVMVQQKKPLAALTDDDLIPKQVDGTPTDVIEIGFLRAQNLVNPQARFRPIIQPGVSISHYQVGAGTLGAVVRHRQTGEKLLLSNNHVFANSNASQIGDAILQPGTLEGGMNPSDQVATLQAFRRLAYIGDVVTSPEPDTPTPDDPAPPQPSPDPTDPTETPDSPTEKPSGGFGFIDFLVALANLLARLTGAERRVAALSAQQYQMFAASAAIMNPPTREAVAAAAQALMGSSPSEVPFIAQQSLDNLLDAAIARPINPANFSDEILQIGRVAGTKSAELGMTVAKFGRTTNYTEGRITLLDATVNVQYETPTGTRTARFVNQVITTGMSKSGDSGSLIVDPSDHKAVGLLFAGSDFATIFTPIDRVLSYFNVEF